jgi:predicted ATPase/class 3 adenylate cyclase
MRRDLPTGTVTFLFTDVEGSTRLLHELGAEGYAEALAEHRRVIRDACAAEGGVEVDTQGDAFFFAFPTAPGAVAAAAAFTDALASGPIQVRVGLHTGSPLLTDEGYIGDDVHRAARVAGSSHGGQVVLTRETHDLVDGFELADLGEYRLKDIAEAVSIFQLGDGSFPPLKTISNTNLPRPASSFLGREAELGEVVARIEGGARLVTLTGPGGIGKTRLAIEAASTLVPEYRAGVFWVGLAPLRHPALVTETIAQTLGARDGLAEHIGERELLLLLDNLEQVIDAAPDLASALERCPNLALLVTSRELLRVRGEVEYAVPPLAEPEAISLFCERAQLEPSAEIAELCSRLDSLPLAVELAAARTKALTPAQILERLSQRLDLLKGGRDADPRQQTLRATIEWSYHLLTEEEQQLLARLSVFAGGCTLAAAEEVADADLDTLQSLVEKSLLRFTNERYWMLETIREYAAEHLASVSEREALKLRHADFVGSWAEQARDGLKSDDTRWLREFDREQANVRAALETLVELDHTESLLPLVGRLGNFWEIRGEWREGREWLETAIPRSSGSRSADRAKALAFVSTYARHAGDRNAARVAGEESLSIFRELGDAKSCIWMLNALYIVASEAGDDHAAGPWLDEAADLAQRIGDDWAAANCNGCRADLALRQGETERAMEMAQSALEYYRSTAWKAGVAWCLYLLALAHFDLGRSTEAAAPAKEAILVAESIGDTETLVWLLVFSAALDARWGRGEVGAELIGAANVLSEQIGLSLGPVEARLRADAVAALQASLGSAAYETAEAEGSTMSVEDAVQRAVSSLD